MKPADEFANMKKAVESVKDFVDEQKVRKIGKDAYKYIPGFNNFDRNKKIIFSALLVIICIFLLFTIGKKENKLVGEMLAYSPVSEAEKIYSKEGPKAAYDFVSFYKSLSKGQISPELLKIREKAEKERASWKYMGIQFIGGIAGIKKDESYAKYADAIASQIPYLSDAKTIVANSRELYADWKKFRQGDAVDTLHFGLAGMGLVSSLYGLIPGVGRAADPLKISTVLLTKSVRFMNNKLRQAIGSLFEPVFTMIKNTKILELKLDNVSDVKRLLAEKGGQIKEVTQLALHLMGRLKPMLVLAANNWPVASLAISTSSSVEELDKYSSLAEKIDARDFPILQFGGRSALEAAARLDARGEFNIDTLKNAMLYGKAGLDAAGVIPAKQLEKDLAAAKSGKSTLWLVFVLCFTGFSIIVLLKTWLFRR